MESEETMTVLAHPAPADVLLADGTIASVRPLRAEDREDLLALHAGLSNDNLRLRFFAANRATGERYVDHLLANPEDVIALVALVRGVPVALATAEVEGDAAE